MIELHASMESDSLLEDKLTDARESDSLAYVSTKASINQALNGCQIMGSTYTVSLNNHPNT